MALSFTMKKGDTAPALRYRLEPSTIDLTGATVVFNMKASGGTAVVTRGAAVIVTATKTPTVEYQWSAGDTATSGTYNAEFEVTYSDGTIETFPRSGYIAGTIGDDLG